MAEDAADRVQYLHKLRAFQQSDFEGIFRAMAGPAGDDPAARPAAPRVPARPGRAAPTRVAVARATGKDDPEASSSSPWSSSSTRSTRCWAPAGCRLGIEWPDVYRMQVAAIMNAACTVKAETGAAPLVEIMIPLVGFEEELRIMRDQVIDVAETVLRERGMAVEYAVGTMIELPRAALRAAEIAHAGRLLLVRHERPHPDHARLQPRRRREQVPDALPPEQRHRLQPVRDHRPGGRRQAGRDGRGRRARPRSRASSWGSAASTAATRPR